MVETRRSKSTTASEAPATPKSTKKQMKQVKGTPTPKKTRCSTPSTGTTRRSRRLSTSTSTNSSSKQPSSSRKISRKRELESPKLDMSMVESEQEVLPSITETKLVEEVEPETNEDDDELDALVSLAFSTVQEDHISLSSSSSNPLSKPPAMVSTQLESGLESQFRRQLLHLPSSSKKSTDEEPHVVRVSENAAVPVMPTTRMGKSLPQGPSSATLRAPSAGQGWFNMQSMELTKELKQDLQVIKMRNYLDPKRFYKSSDHKRSFPKIFQVGTVIEGAHEFKASRVVNKERQNSLMNEVMADTKLKKYVKRKYSEIQTSKSSGGKGFLKKKHAQRQPKWAANY